MPRGQKSKLRAREKRRQARVQPKNPVGAQATVPEEKESPSSPSPGFKGDPRSSPATGTPSNPQVPQGACSSIASATAVSKAGANEYANSQVQGMLKGLQIKDVAEPWDRSPVDIKVIELVHYLLHKYRKKEPITKADMLRNVILTYKQHYREIFSRASQNLELIFGLDMKELDPNRNAYVLVNKLELSCDSGDQRDVPKTGLLMAILGVIFTKDNCASEEEVWKMLNLMGLYAGKKHFVFGEPKNLITEDLVNEGYLEYRQVPNSDPPRYEFLWGPRAHAETSKMKVLEFMAKILNTVPSAFPRYYEEALQDEEERARARAAARTRSTAVASARSRVVACRFSCPK